MVQILECCHLSGFDKAPHIPHLIALGRLTCIDGKTVCDARVPLAMDLAVGQDISCVGPASPDCPHPEDARLVTRG